MITNLKALLSAFRHLPPAARVTLAKAWRAAKNRERFALYVHGPMGSGKSLLASCLLEHEFGPVAATMIRDYGSVPVERAAELGYCYLDNYYRRTVFHASLICMLTSARLVFRRLGSNRFDDLPNGVFTLITANYPPADDLSRRCEVIELPEPQRRHTITRYVDQSSARNKAIKNAIIKRKVVRRAR